ncbi:MAG: FHA domain-containing protein [Gemmatimonadota bacterium]|nr:FHA domain-containing protein [Gemmatimonadota bacterium]
MDLAFGGRRVTVTAEDLIIGSDPAAALVVQGLGVLPRHALVRMRPDGGVEVKSADAGSFLLHNGARVGSTPQVVAAGDRLVIGDQEIIALAPGAAVGAAQRLNVTMMGMPAVTPGSYQAAPAQVPTQRRPSRLPMLVVGGVVLVLLAYFFLFQG